MEEENCCQCGKKCPTCGGNVPKDKPNPKESSDGTQKMNLNDVCEPDKKSFNLND